jgi:putative isomerase
MNKVNLMKIKFLACCFITLFISCNSVTKQNEYKGIELRAMKATLSKGWNTWNTRSVLSHVLLPDCFAIDLQLISHQSGDTLKEALIGRESYASKELVIPGPHSYDGSYTELTVEWQGIRVRVQSAAKNDGLFLMINPVKYSAGDTLLIHPQMLWKKMGEIRINENRISAVVSNGKTIELTVAGGHLVSTKGNIKLSLAEPIIISTDASLSAKEIEKIISDAGTKLAAQKSGYPKAPELYDAMQTVLVWNLIYEPTKDQVIAPISRTWNVGWEGWILFDWDTYFAAYMFSLDSKENAYANAIAITNEITTKGFIPNFGSARSTSEDRSEPPVGSFVVKEIYRKYGEKWFLTEVFDKLLKWNRWWAANRDVDGYLCFGSDPYPHGKLPAWLEKGIGTKKGAKWESGMDNSPMFDGAAFDSISHRMIQADVGLMSLYIWDCQNLSEVAVVLGKKQT